MRGPLVARIAERRDGYLAEFERVSRDRNGDVLASLGRLREEAITRFRELGFPTTKLEEWRFTSVARIAETTFALAGDGLSDVSAVQLNRFAFETLPYTQLVFVNGRYTPQFSSRGALPAGTEAGGSRRGG